MPAAPTDFVVNFVRGIDNRNDETKLRAGYARAAENVDINADGGVDVREGFTLFSELVGAHSLWTAPNLPFFLVAADSTLYAMDTQGALTAVVTGLGGTDVSYATYGSRVYWSDGVVSGIIDPDMSAHAWGVETPLPTFFLVATATGSMHAGRYGVTMTFAHGEEGGAPDPVYVDVPEGGGIHVMGISAPQQGPALPVRLYRTSINGPDFFYATTFAAGTTNALLGAQQLGQTLKTLFSDKFPAASHLLFKAGRIFGAQRNQLVWSSALYYGQLEPTAAFVTFSEPITMIASPNSQSSQSLVLYVGTTKKTYLLVGASIETAAQVTVLACGVVPGSMTMIPAEELDLDNVTDDSPAWIGTDGVPYLGAPDGARALNKSCAYPIYEKAAAVYMENGGNSRYIVAGRGGRTSGFVATDSVVAMVYDNGGGT